MNRENHMRGEGMSNYSIAISREYGSGGRIVGKQVADRLGIKFYDKELLSMVAEKSGLSEEFIENAGYKRNPFFHYDLYGVTQERPLAEQVIITETRIIEDLADRDSCVFIGRNASYVLEERKNAISVFVHAPLEWRVNFAETVYDEHFGDMTTFVRKQDKKRAEYNKALSGRKWGVAFDYDLCIDSRIGVDATTEVIIAYVKAFLEA
jgi:cytidylate kinase